jgi:hypothetical protein
VATYNGVMFNWSAAFGAWALGGPLWAAIAFLGVALARAAMDVRALRRETAALRHRLITLEGPFAPVRYDDEAAPDSQIRLSRPSPMPLRAVG